MKCTECGAELPTDAPEGMCPVCLMKAGLSTQLKASDVPTLIGAPSFAPPGAPAAPATAAPVPGRPFGGYLIARELGRGGMGAVYEAEHLESGRRVALKVLGQTFDSSEARRRFLREGRLAASVNHPNSVYIYGTEEIDGSPAITMELVPGGTLQDRVRGKGPLPVGEAIDAVLQIISGLEAAQAVGVLHRDIKPSNCFVDVDGTVKVGDYGLSIYSEPRAETNLTTSGTFLGTPAFSSPEQLRGDELTVRSDIYSVGVTLYYLLTARTPHEGKDLVQLIATVLDRPPDSPARWRPGLSKGLAKAVLRCLAKNPGDRFRNYAELRGALLPYGSEAPTPAALGLRFFAGCVDFFLLTIAMMPVSLMFFTDMKLWADPAKVSMSVRFLGFLGYAGVWTLFYALPEGRWGASLGKAIFGLRVVGPNRGPAGVPRALLRAAVFYLLPILPSMTQFAVDPGVMMNIQQSGHGMVIAYSMYVLMALLFVTARRRNGFAGIHELLSSTRVVLKSVYRARPVAARGDQALPDTESKPKIGPYHVLASLGTSGEDEIVLGFDTRILRRVWIRKAKDGAPAVEVSLRQLRRPGRLRWLNGKRAPGEAWDAYEAPSGRPLVAVFDAPQPWSAVRYWLHDLARELETGMEDGSIPAVLSMDRVWVTGEGRAKFLDFAAPGVTAEIAPSGGRDREGAKLLLKQVAVSALEGRAVPAGEAAGRSVVGPIALAARSFVDDLAGLKGPREASGRLHPLLEKPADVSRPRRLALLAGCAFVPVMVLAMQSLGILLFQKWARDYPDLMPLSMSLSHHEALGKWGPMPEEKLREQRRAIEVYVAHRFRDAIQDEALMSSMMGRSLIPPDKRALARRILEDHPSPTEGEVAEAKVALGPFVRNLEPGGFQGFIPEDTGVPKMGVYLMMGGMMFFMLIGAPALFCAIVFRGGILMRLLGVDAVRRDGARASRLRLFWRQIVTWSPFLAVPFLLPLVRDETAGVAIGLALATLFLCGAALSVVSQRSLQDRLAGTWLVPR